MQKSLLFKILAIVALTALIGIALGMIQFTISERAAFRAQAVASIASESVREQTIVGPVLIIDYVDEYDEQVKTDKPGEVKDVTHSDRRQHLVFPNELVVSGRIATNRRYKGIHQVLVYAGQHKLSGDFTMPSLNELPRASTKSRITLGRASIAVGIDDVRGIRNIPQLKWNDASIEFQQGSGLSGFSSGLHAPLPPLALGARTVARFDFDLGLDGIERQSFVPVGKNNKVSLASNWPHPQFGGRFLPALGSRVINDQGFSASWSISSLSSDAQRQLAALQGAREGNGAAEVDRFSVGFIEPVNVYSLAERATKYGLLFVVLTFAAFFIFEMLKRLPIHPIQYLLVGLALAMFFLLLVSLSEHVAFAPAYLVASGACIALLGFYLSYVLRDWRRGMGFGCALTLLYGALYGLLISENNALVLGSLLLFAILAGVMIATRKVDWYQISQPAPVAGA